jgi:hypothetical protein
MATHADAELILKLYDLRRESVCREARKWFGGWQPANEAEIQQITTDNKRQENAYYRQALTYWEMAFSIANSGAIDADLFAKNCGEGIFYCLKCQHLKKKFPNPTLRTMPEAEAFIADNPIAQKKAEMFKARFA